MLATTEAGQDGTTVADLVSVMDGAFAGAVSLSGGQILLTDFNFGESNTTITLTAGTGNTGMIDLPGFVLTSKGFSPKTSTSIEVFDSLGTKHTLNITFTKSENIGEWVFEVTLAGNETINEGSSGSITFDSNGALQTILYDNGQSLFEFNPGNGASVVRLNLDFENSTGFSGITQFAGRSSVTLPFQDGQAHGTLSAFAIDDQGKVIGSFTNGRNRLIGLSRAERGDP